MRILFIRHGEPDYENDGLTETGLKQAGLLTKRLMDEGIDEWLAGFGYIREGYYYRHTLEEKEHRSIALFCHGGSSAAAMGHLLNLPFPYACALFHLEFTGITIIRLDRTKGSCSLPCLELANDGRHIHETADPELIS